MFYCGMVEFEAKPAQIKLIIQNQEGNAMHKICCAFVSQQKSVCYRFYKSGRVGDLLKLNDNTLTPADLTSVGYVISNTSHSIKSIHMSHCGLHDKHIKAFLMGNSTQRLPNIEELNLSHNNIGPDGTQTLAHTLSCGNKIKVLHLSENNISADGTRILTGALKCCNKLEELDLSQNNIGQDGAISLVYAFSKYSKFKVKFNIEDVPFALAGVHKICPKLKVLNLLDNIIGAHGAQTLPPKLNSCYELKVLDLSGNIICPDGAKLLQVCSDIAFIWRN